MQMKIRPIRLTTAATVALLLSGFAVRVLAYPTNYGPFPPGHEPAAITLTPCNLEHEVKPSAADTDDNAGAVREYRLPAVGQGQKQITLALRGTTNGWAINLRDAQGRPLLSVPGTNSMTTAQMEVFSCDLNGDSQPDFIVNVWSGGCGLAAEGSEVTFLLSAKDGYRATSFYLYDFGKPDLVRFQPQGPVYFIFNDLIGNDGEKTRDGRDHNFWVYNLHRIDGSRFIPADADQPGFPKWIWFRNQATHEETSQLTQEQKIKLQMKRNFSK
jgi:hypothetical protein